MMYYSYLLLVVYYYNWLSFGQWEEHGDYGSANVYKAPLHFPYNIQVRTFPDVPSFSTFLACTLCVVTSSGPNFSPSRFCKQNNR